MEYFDYNLTDAFVIEPVAIQSYSKLNEVNRFNRQESAREQSRRNDPASIRFLNAGIVIVFIVVIIVLFICFLKYCQAAPFVSTSTKNDCDLSHGKWMPVPHGTLAEGDGEPSMSLFVPTTQIAMKGSGIKCSKPACVCAPGGGYNKKRQKGWRRNYDDESYGPSNV